mgnify:CR=1 FL=1
MDMVNIKINGMSYEVAAGSTILEAAREAGIDIPTLCFLKDVNQIGACRMCMVEVKGAKSLVAACVYPVNEGMEVFTNTPKVQKSRKMTLELLLSVHDRKCLSCKRSGTCELQKLCNDMGIDSENRSEGAVPAGKKDYSTLHLERDNAKCILCRRCVAACQQQHVAVIGANNRGFDTEIGCAFEMPLSEVACVSCGQCIVACPTGALTEKDNTQQVIDAINDPEKVVVVQTAPAVRAALGEEFGMPIGTNVEGKMVAALRRLGFDKVYDTDFGADMTIMEEANEFIDRVKNGGKLPIITSCSPGWIKYCEHYFPDMTENLSSCKSPQQMFGSIAKTFWAEKMGIPREKLVVVSIMPCLAKKYECDRNEFKTDGSPDVDYSISTRELARLIRRANVGFTLLTDKEFDHPMGASTGAGVIFGTTGGVMEAALRSVYEIYTGRTLENVNFEQVRGLAGVRRATIDLDGFELKVGIAHGLGNARQLLEDIRHGRNEYHVIEIMACPGGCIGGGGQPLHHGNSEVLYARANALYREDAQKPLRKSHENPYIKTLYEEYLGKPLSETAERLLHTHYFNKAID